MTASAATDLVAWEKKHPDNYWLLKLRASAAGDGLKLKGARAALERLVELYPQQKGSDSA